MKDIIIGIIILVSLFIALIITIKEERNLQDKRLKNEIEKIKLIIEELKK